MHVHPLTIPAQLPLRRWTDRPTAAALLCASFLERKQLLPTIALIVDLRRCLDEVLQMGAREEVAQIDEFAVVLILDVDDTPAVLAASYLAAVDDHGLFGADDGEGNDVLYVLSASLVLLVWVVLEKNTLICALSAISSWSYSSLSYGYIRRLWKANSCFILFLNSWRSSSVKLSLFAMTGTTLTTSHSFLRTTISIGFNACPLGWMKNKQQWMRVS